MNLTFTNLADRFAAAAAVQDPSLLTRLCAPPSRPPALRSETAVLSPCPAA